MNKDYRIKLENIIGESVAIRNSKKEALIASKSTSTVLITGESGTVRSYLQEPYTTIAIE